MKYTKQILIAMAGLLTVACSNDSEIGENQANNSSQEPVEIKLGSSLNATTRAYNLTQGNVIATGQTVYAWIDDAGSTSPSVAASEYVKGWTLTAAAPASAGAPQALNSVGTTKYYFPSTGRNINIYALHGNFNNSVTDGSTTWATFSSSLTHSVEANQHTAGNYEKSDLFCAHLLNQSKSSTTLQLPFKHVLSKIEVYLFRGVGVTAADLAGISSITLKNPVLTGTVSLTKPTTTTANVASVAVPSTSNKGDITMKLQTKTTGEDMSSDAPSTGFSPADNDKNAYAFGEAVIIPQYVSTDGASTGSAVDFISVNYSAGGSLIAKIKQEFTSGNRYRYFIVVNRTGLQLTATLADWTSAGSAIPGIAE